MAFEWISYCISSLKKGDWSWKDQPFQCRLCGDEGQRENFAYSHVLDVCTKCAEVCSNLYDLSHGGDFARWDSIHNKDATAYEKKPIPESLRWEVFQRDGFTCCHCGSMRFLRADHIFPEVLGGEATMDNLQTLCRSCNSKKGKKT